MLEHDVLVIGGGLAGLRAALEARSTGVDVAVISKVHPVRSHSNAAQGGINAALTDRGDTWEEHAYETVKGSDYLGDQDAIEVLCKEAGQAIIELEHMGVVFSRDETGHLGTRAFGGQQRARTFFVADFTGQAMLHVMYEQMIKSGILVYEEWFLTSLVIEDGECHGVVAIEMLTGKLQIIKAKAVIMASGGLGRLYEPTTNAMICTGDGIALAYRAGAPLMDMEMVQYHPTTLKSNGVLITEAARGEGAYLINSKGERFMEKYAPNMMELASRDVVSRAEQTEINEGRDIDGCVLLDLRHLGREKIHERLSYINEVSIDFLGIDLAEAPVPVRPGMHYQMGGVKTNVDGATIVPGLYAAGECACVSVHGGNRLGANSLLDTIVFGRRSGKAAAMYAREKPSKQIPESRVSQDEAHLNEIMARADNGDTPAKIRSEMGVTMNDYAAVFRTTDGMKIAREKLISLKERYQNVPVQDKGKVFNTNIISTLELGFMLDCAETIVVSALERKESRGAHYMAEYPQRDDEHWMKHISVQHTTDGPQVGYIPVIVTQWEPQIRSY
jgi:succinate dehydrogenase / fumarate reductase flavoprotein subunit